MILHIFSFFVHLFLCRYPHEKYTLGFAGRGGGNAIYFSTLNNTMTHGPGTDRGGKDPEADSCFGRVLAGSGGEHTVWSMQKQPGAKGAGFVSDNENHIKIVSLKLLSLEERDNMIININKRGIEKINDGNSQKKNKLSSLAKYSYADSTDQKVSTSSDLSNSYNLPNYCEEFI